MTLRASDSILVCLLDGEKSTADIVFELDFRPSTVYTTLSEQVSAGWITLHRAKGKRGYYRLTEAGQERAEKIDSSMDHIKNARGNTQIVYDAILAGEVTYAAIVTSTKLTRIQVYSAMQRLMRDAGNGARVVRTDSLGKGGRGGPVTARFAVCR